MDFKARRWMGSLMKFRPRDFGMEFYWKNPTQIGSRPRGLIGLRGGANTGNPTPPTHFY